LGQKGGKKVSLQREEMKKGVFWGVQKKMTDHAMGGGRGGATERAKKGRLAPEKEPRRCGNENSKIADVWEESRKGVGKKG